MDLDSAIGKHAEWKMKLRSAISKQETLDAATISRDNCCELGKWLHGDGQTSFGRLASFRECLTRHAAFHVEAGRVAATINARKYPEAMAMLNAGTGYAAASAAVNTAIMSLKKEANL
jgi:methyl-accepting chemotaxis protein